MTNFEKMCKEYRENKRMIEELTKMNDALKADILQYIGDNDVYIEGNNKVTNTIVITERLDTKELKNRYPNIFVELSHPCQSRRFSVKQYRQERMQVTFYI